MFGTRSGRGAAIAAAIGMLGAAPGFAQSPAALATPAVAAAAPTLKTLTAFDGIDGELPGGSLIADAKGNLFGTTEQGGGYGYGTLFELVKTAIGYAKTPNILFSFYPSRGDAPAGALITDAKGNLYGTTVYGGTAGDGAVFALAKTAAGYANTPVVLASFTGKNGMAPYGSLSADARGNLFGTTSAGGAHALGTVFELVKMAGSYKLRTLVSFTGANGSAPYGSLIADTRGNLYGTTTGGGARDAGTVFEIAKTPTGYARTPTILKSFTVRDGATPHGSLIADSKGNLFGTTQGGGDTTCLTGQGCGTVFELVRSGARYTLKTLVKFNSSNGAHPAGSLIADAKGNLFGTTFAGGTTLRCLSEGKCGTVFKIVKTATGYAAKPNTLAFFDIANGRGPAGSLIADANGNLFGTTTGGGAHGDGTVFEIVHSGFVPK